MELRAENVCMRFFRKRGEANFFEAVCPVSLTLKSGELTVLKGKSGSGKTTLTHILAGLLRPTEGNVFLDQTNLYALSDETLSELRNKKIGLVPQGRSAVDNLTVYENILLPGLLYSKADNSPEAEKWMEILGIVDLRDAMPAELSGGELRRLAIARVLTNGPQVILADEPTGDLDDENTRKVLSAFHACAHEENKAVFIVTHENDALEYADRVLTMDNGRITFPLSVD